VKGGRWLLQWEWGRGGIKKGTDPEWSYVSDLIIRDAISDEDRRYDVAIAAENHHAARFPLDFPSRSLSRCRAARWLAEQTGELDYPNARPLRVYPGGVFNLPHGKTTRTKGGFEMRQLRAVLWMVMVAQVLLPSAPRAQVPDHLKCYKVKESAKKAIYTADLGGWRPSRGAR
jgi:hypothetical protein